MPARIVSQLHLTGQAAALGTTTLFTTVQPGAYRLSWSMKKTTADTVSSTLGGMTLVYTDPDNTSCSITAPFIIAAGTVATTNATDSATVTGLCLGVPLYLNCKAASVISVAVAYASNTPGNMIYNAHFVLEIWDVN